MAPLYTLRMRSPLLHAGGKSMSLWLRSHQLLCWICWCKGVRACSQERQALQGTAAGRCSNSKLQWSLQQVQHIVPTGPPGTQRGAKRPVCHTGWGASSQKEKLTKYALLHHGTRTLQILKNKWEQDSDFSRASFQTSVLAGDSWKQLISCRSWCPSSGGSHGLVAVRDQGEDNSFRCFRDFDNRQQTASLTCGNRDAWIKQYSWGERNNSIAKYNFA